MMNKTKLSFLTIAIPFTLFFFIGLTSCQNDETAIQELDGSEFEVESRSVETDRPAEIPQSEEWILLESTKGPLDWREVKAWYLNDLSKREDDPSVPNLKSITVGMLVKNSTFLKEAGKEDLLFFAGEIVNNGKVRGNPMDIAEILAVAADGKAAMQGTTDLPDREIMKLAAKAEAKYFEGAATAREEIKAQYEHALSTLASLHRDRWGSSQVLEVK
jgi:hypothetical protein